MQHPRSALPRLCDLGFPLVAQFRAALQKVIPANVGPNPESNETGLEGAWDFDIRFSFNLNGRLAMSGAAERISLADVLEKQLGLKLEKREVPMPTEFEVAVIKPTPPDFL